MNIEERGGTAARSSVGDILSGHGAIHSTSILKSSARASPTSSTLAPDFNPEYSTAPFLQDRIISERMVEKEVMMPRRDGVEGMELRKVHQKIIEIAQKRIVEKIVEVPEFEYREKVVSVLEKVKQERITEVPVVEYQDRITEVPKIVYKEKEVKVPEYEYIEVVTYKDVEVVTVEEEHIITEVSKPIVVEQATPTYVDIKHHVPVDMNVPIPMESIMKLHFELPKLNVLYKRIPVPVQVPKFVEIPVPAEFFPAGYASYADDQREALLDLLKNPDVHASGISQHDIMTLQSRIEGSMWPQLFENAPIASNSRGMVTPIDTSKFVDQAFKNGEYDIDIKTLTETRRTYESQQQERRSSLRKKFESKLDSLREEARRDLEALNAKSCTDREVQMKAAVDVARAQAEKSLIAAGVDPTEYLTMTFDEALEANRGDTVEGVPPIAPVGDVADTTLAPGAISSSDVGAPGSTSSPATLTPNATASATDESTTTLHTLTAAPGAESANFEQSPGGCHKMRRKRKRTRKSNPQSKLLHSLAK